MLFPIPTPLLRGLFRFMDEQDEEDEQNEPRGLFGHFGGEFGVLDPYFFALFLKSTRGLEHLARLVRHEFHDAARVLDLLAVAGHLEMVEGPSGRGWVVREKETRDP